MIRTLALVFLLLCGMNPAAGIDPIQGQETHVMVVVGLGGDAEYRQTFHGWASDLISAAQGRLGVDGDHVVYLGERPDDAPDLMDGRSTVEQLETSLEAMAQAAAPGDRVLIFLIGHGTGQGEEVEFNLPGPDLTPGALDRMLDRFQDRTVAVVNAASSSGPFLPVLSGPNRLVLTATRSAQERNETQFGRFFVDALTQDGSDLDKDGRVSLAEAFQYARREVDRYYESQNLLATEHAQLDDNGDGEGTGDLGGGQGDLTEEAADGRLARMFWIGSSSGPGAGAQAQDSLAQADPELRRLLEERADLERQVRELRALRGQMEEARYEAALEALLVELALKSREIREKGGGAS